MKKLTILFLVTFLISSCGNKKINLCYDFRIEQNDMSRNYNFYFKEDGILGNKKCLMYSFNTRTILLKIQDETKDSIYFAVINTNDFIKNYPSVIDLGLSYPQSIIELKKQLNIDTTLIGQLKKIE